MKKKLDLTGDKQYCIKVGYCLAVRVILVPVAYLQSVLHSYILELRFFDRSQLDNSMTLQTVEILCFLKVRGKFYKRTTALSIVMWASAVNHS